VENAGDRGHGPDVHQVRSQTGADGGRGGEHDRWLRLPGTSNLRDLGGYPGTDGGTVRWRTLLRSDALHRLDDSGRAVLAGLGLRTVIDLRTDEEVRAAPSALDGAVDTGGTGVRTYHVPLFDASAIGRLPPELAAIYRYMIDDCGAAVAEAVGRLCAANALPGLIHCTAGKDRTGLVAAIVLSVVGVPDDIIAADYAMSGTHLDPGAATAISRIRAVSGVGRWLDLGALGAQPRVIHEALAHIRARAGSVTGYLLQNGLTRPDIETLRRTLVVPPGPPRTAGSPIT
jgi:protein-tyrosine phosphatase